MRVLVFAKGDRTVPSSNFRAWILTDYLARVYGWEFEFIHSISYPFWSLSQKRWGTWRCIIRTARSKPYDAIFVQKVLFPIDIIVLILFLKMYLCIPLLYDVDDPQWAYAKTKDKLIAKAAACVFCATPVFAEYYQSIGVTTALIPTVIDHEKYAPYRIGYQSKGQYTVGWVGAGMGHFRDGNMSILKPVLERLANKGHSIRFLLIGAQDYRPLLDYFTSSAYVFEPISYVPFSDVPKKIQEFDIAVTPLNEKRALTETNAAAKGLEYMACGVPTVASRVGAYKDVIQDGINGFLASSEEEWSEKLEKLFSDSALRKRIGKAGMETVVSTYSYLSILPRVKKEFDHAVR